MSCDGTEDARVESLRALLRQVRAARRGRRSSVPTATAVPAPFGGYLAWELGDLCERLFHDLQSLEGIPEDDRDAFAAYYGLLGPPRPLSEVACRLRARHGGAPRQRQVQHRMARTLRALARALEDDPTAGANRSTRLDPPRWPGVADLRARMLDPHYRAQFVRALDRARSLAAEEPEPRGDRTRLSVPLALGQLAADALGGDPPADHLGTPIAPWLRWRLRALAWTTVVAIAPTLGRRPAETGAHAPPPSVAAATLATCGGEAAARLAEAVSSDRPRAGGIETLLDSAQAALQVVDGSTARACLNLAARALAHFGAGDLLHLRRRALQLEIAADGHVGALSAFDKARQLELLAGVDSPSMFTASLDLAVMLSVFGHLEDALEVLRRQYARLEALPYEHRTVYRRWLRLRVAVTLHKRAVATGLTEDLNLAERILLCDFDDPHGPGPYPADLERTVAQISLARGELTHRGNRRGAQAAYERAAALLAEPPIDPDRHDPVDASVPGQFRVVFRWALVAMGTAVHTADASAFERAATVGIRQWNASPTVPAFGLALRQAMRHGAKAFQLDLPALSRPAPFTGWDHDFRPPARVLTLVGNRSWACPTAVICAGA